MKKSLRFLLLLFFLFSLVSLLPVSAIAGALNPDLLGRIKLLTSSDTVPVIIHLKDKARIDAIQDENRNFRRARIISALKNQASVSQKDIRKFLRQRGVFRERELWITNSIAVTLPVSVLTELNNFSDIEQVIPDYTIYGPVINQGTASIPEWNIAAVNAPDLWNLGYSGTGIVVANMDTGVDSKHQDLRTKWRGGTNSWFNPYALNCVPCTSPYRLFCPVRIECRACDLNAVEPCDLYGHGTGTIGVMVGGDADGSYIGVAPAATWISAKIFADPVTSIPNAQPEATASAIHEAFQWLLDPDGNPATDDAPDVVNASWGIDGPNTCNTLFQTDIQALKTSGIAVVFSAGNDGPGTSTSSSPANYPESFSVGAVDEYDGIAYFSSRGPGACDGSLFPDVVAPGVSIKLAGLTSGGIFPGSYFYGDGTSFAAPHVAGAMALLMEVFPQAGVSQVEDALRQTAIDLGAVGPDNVYGYGLIDVAGAKVLLSSEMNEPFLEISPDFLDFGPFVMGGSSSPAMFTITNRGMTDLVLGSITISGVNSSEFSLSGDNCSNGTLISQSSCSLGVVFHPDSVGPKSAALSIPSNDPQKPTSSVSLTGTGIVLPVTVTAPNGGESWAAGTSQTIRWTYTGSPGIGFMARVRIELLKGGALNRTIASFAAIGTGGNGSYQWIIPNTQTPGPDYTIRVTKTTDAAATDVSNANFTITGTPLPGITVTVPNGGESWAAGTTQTISWTFTGSPGSAVRIELLKGGVLNRTVATSTAIGTGGNGSYNWTIPTTQTSGSDFTIRVTSTTDSSATDVSDVNFTITGMPPPGITVTAPNGGESWTAGTSQTIRWTYTGSPGIGFMARVRIELLKGGALNRTIASFASIGSGGNGSYNWAIPITQTPGPDYTIRITKTTDAGTTDVSDANFTITGTAP